MANETRAETAERLLVLAGVYFKRRGFDPEKDRERMGEMYRLAVEEGLGELSPWGPSPARPELSL